MKVAELFEELKAFREEVKSEIQGLKSQVNDIKQLSERVACVEKKVDDNLAAIQARLDNLEGQSRRSNIILYGVPEADQESWEQTETRFKEVVSGKLGVQHEVHIERCHRLGRKQQNKSRPIIAKMTFFKDKVRVMAQAHKLKESNLALSDDYTKAVREKRKKLLPHMHRARNNRKRATLTFDKLKIDDEIYAVNHVGKVVNTRTGAVLEGN